MFAKYPVNEILIIFAANMYLLSTIIPYLHKKTHYDAYTLTVNVIFVVNVASPYFSFSSFLIH